jgi:pectin methylesterase-like acyl-CoA thioesterase
VEGVSIDTRLEYVGSNVTLPWCDGATAFVNDTESAARVNADSTAAVIQVTVGELRSISVLYPYVEPQRSDSGTVTIKWPWNTGAYVANGTFSDDDSALAFASATATYNEEYLTYSSKTDKTVKATWIAFQPKEQIAEPDINYAVDFKVTPAGVSFTPTSVSFNTMRFGTDSGKLDVYAVYDNEEVLLDQGIVPERDSKGQTSISHELEARTTTNPFILRIYIYSLGSSKQIGFNHVTISGTWHGSSDTQQYNVTAVASPAEGGTVSLSPAGGIYREGAVVTLKATANKEYNFQSWTDEEGKVVSEENTFEYTVTGDASFTANFKAYSDYTEIFEGCAPYNAAVRSIDELIVALDAAAKREDLDTRYFIFLFNGIYDFGTTALTKVVKNTSLIGESMDGVLILNNPGAVTKYQDQTPVLFIDQNQNGVYMQDLTIRQARDWDSKKSAGQACALRQRGKQAIYKNVRLEGVQDTYYLNKADATAYFEDCDIAGEVDFIYGDGTAFFEQCTLRPISANATITAPNTQTGYKGMVFNDCTIDGAAGYRLGRPWGDSPASTYLHTTMVSLPNAAGWGAMSSGLVVRFHEYDSKDAEGKTLDLSSRSIAACSPAAGSDACVITAEEAAEYALDKVFTNWYPQSFTQQLSVEVVLADNMLTWTCPDSALGFVVLKDSQIVAFTGDPYYKIPEGDAAGRYTVRTANLMGGLGAPSNAVTGIREVLADETQDSTPMNYYNLFGQRVDQRYRGLVISPNQKSLK